MTVPSPMPPCNIEAELCTLGSLLLDNSVIDELSVFLVPDDFFRDSHQILYRSILELHSEGSPTDPMTLLDHLERRGLLGEVGGELAIRSAIDAPPHAGNAVYYAQIVRQKAVARRLIEQANATIRECYSNTFAAGELQELAESRIFAIGDAQVSAGISRSSEGLDDFSAKLERRMMGEVTGLSSGIKALDNITDGFQPGSLTIIGARPSMGKTALVLNIVDHVTVDLEVGVLFVSMEMSRGDLLERMVCTRAEVNSKSVRNAFILKDHELGQIREASAVLRDHQFHIDDGGGQTVGKICANARRLKARHGLGLIVVDYLQLIEGDQAGESRQEQIGKISRRLKQLAMELDIPVIGISQLNRQAEAREDHRPRMSDLRESGAIEQDADVVMLLHRPEYYDENDYPGLAELDIAKNRNGAVGTARLEFRKAITKFNSL